MKVFYFQYHFTIIYAYKFTYIYYYCQTQIDFYLSISYKPIQNGCVLAYKLVIYI